MVNMKNIILAKNAPERAVYTLEDMGYNVIPSGCLSGVQTPLAYHPDMQIVKCGDSYICAPECYGYYRNLPGTDIVQGESVPGYSYPEDIAYNIAVTGIYAIHNFKYTEQKFLEKSPYIHISVKQGYSKCSVCVVSEDAVITSDKCIAVAASEAGLDVLAISPGYVSLPGYDYGFIGGASGLIDSGLLCFCGDITTHPDSYQIVDFCRKHGVEVVSLCDGTLVDVGTIIAVG